MDETGDDGEKGERQSVVVTVHFRGCWSNGQVVYVCGEKRKEKETREKIYRSLCSKRGERASDVSRE